MHTESVISTKHLKKKFPTQKGGFLQAVQGVHLEVFEKEIFGFLGPNGAGKTTTMKMLTTLLPLDADGGEAYVAGYNVKTDPEEVRKNIGFVTQKGGADEDATGYENIILQGKLYGMREEKIKKAMAPLVDTFSLGSFINRFVRTYSGGQKRRLDIALAMIHTPKILFLDEPTTGLDPQSRANLWQKITYLKQQGVTIFITSHYLDEIDTLADRLAIIDGGKVVAIGSPASLKKEIAGDVINIGISQMQQTCAIHILKEQAYVRELIRTPKRLSLYVDQGDQALADVLRLLDGKKIKIDHISLSIPTLDHVFLKKTGHSLREEIGS